MKAVPKAETKDGGNVVQKFRVKILSYLNSQTNMDVLCDVLCKVIFLQSFCFLNFHLPILTTEGMKLAISFSTHVLIRTIMKSSLKNILVTVGAVLFLKFSLTSEFC